MSFKWSFTGLKYKLSLRSHEQGLPNIQSNMEVELCRSKKTKRVDCYDSNDYYYHDDEQLPPSKQQKTEDHFTSAIDVVITTEEEEEEEAVVGVSCLDFFDHGWGCTDVLSVSHFFVFFVCLFP